MQIRRLTIVTACYILGAAFLASGIATAISFPWSKDPQGDESTAASVRRYYDLAYDRNKVQDKQGPPVGAVAPLSAKEQYYIDTARKQAVTSHIPEDIARFVAEYDLKDKKVLEVGAGSGLLQDSVADYTGLDISATARRFFHKRFVEASATAMPFPDNSFDAIWTVWVLEHIPNPEKALIEMRRVLRPGGILLLRPALEVSRYAAQGYEARPYGDLDWRGKLVKASIPVTKSRVYHYLEYHQVRALRTLSTYVGSGPSRLHFIRLDANYDKYWQGDSDAATSLSADELYLWFTTRGDTCLNCPSRWQMALHDLPMRYLILRINKSGTAPQRGALKKVVPARVRARAASVGVLAATLR